jgi:hypothetical protein
MKTHTRYLPHLCPTSFEAGILLDILSSVEDDIDLTRCLERFLTMNQKDRSAYGVKALTIGFWRMSLPLLMAEGKEDDTERAKFLDSLNTHT